MKFIAHRGYSRRFAENSLEAFDAVIRHPQNGRALIGIELDVHLTKDNRIPVMHDMTVKDSAGRSIEVAELSFSELQENFSRTHGSHYPRIPELEEVLELVSHETELNIEVKTGAYDFTLFTDHLAQALKRYRPDNDIVLSSFSHDALSALRPALSHLDVKYGFLFDSWKSWDDLTVVDRMILHYVHPRYDLLLENPEALSEINMPAQCWIVNDSGIVKKMLALPDAKKIRTIMTDDLDLAEQFGE